jgi:hypothetical protein
MTTESQLGIPDSPTPESARTLKRRGLLAAAVAFVAGLVAKVTEQPVSAGTDGDVVLGAANFTAGTTRIACSSGTVGTALRLESLVGGGSPALVVNGSTAGAIYADMISDPDGFVGSAAILGVGVGFSAGLGGTNADGTAVRGVSESGIGVLGRSTSRSGVQGQILSSSNAIAVYGENVSDYAGPSLGAGGFGVYGFSRRGHGLVGATGTPGGAAVVGATNGIAGSYAAVFYGPAVVSGAFTVVGGPKSAAVPHPDGSLRRLYCMESPESWFEDIGTARLDGGCAAVALDSDFAAVVDLSCYHVFLTQYDAHNVLAVSDRTATGFRVHANNPDASSEFSWRVVAKRKDIASPRLEPVMIPPEPTLPPPVPDIPAPTRPDLSVRG